MKILGLAILGVALLGAASEACPPVFYAYRAAPVRHVRPVVAVQFVPVIVPAYTATFGSPGGGPDVQQLLAEVQRLKAQVEGLSGGSGGKAGGLGPAATPALGALSAACARCHTGATAKGKFKLFEEGGALAPLTGEQAGEALTRVIRGEMPPDRKLAAEQKIAVLAELTGK